MNKSDFIAAIADKTGMTKKNVEAVLAAYADVVVDTLKKGDKVQLVGFGTYEVRSRNAREAKNPQTGETIHIAATNVPAFKVGKAFKDAFK